MTMISNMDHPCLSSVICIVKRKMSEIKQTKKTMKNCSGTKTISFLQSECTF